MPCKRPPAVAGTRDRRCSTRRDLRRRLAERRRGVRPEPTAGRTGPLGAEVDPPGATSRRPVSAAEQGLTAPAPAAGLATLSAGARPRPRARVLEIAARRAAAKPRRSPNTSPAARGCHTVRSAERGQHFAAARVRARHARSRSIHHNRPTAAASRRGRASVPGRRPSPHSARDSVGSQPCTARERFNMAREHAADRAHQRALWSRHQPRAPSFTRMRFAHSGLPPRAPATSTSPPRPCSSPTCTSS